MHTTVRFVMETTVIHLEKITVIRRSTYKNNGAESVPVKRESVDSWEGKDNIFKHTHIGHNQTERRPHRNSFFLAVHPHPSS
jgi:hypothetical protein